IFRRNRITLLEFPPLSGIVGRSQRRGASMRMPLAIFLACAMSTGVAHAQANLPSLTQDEIAERFERQKTRGLVIAPVSQGAAQQPEAGAVVELAPAAPVARAPAQQPAGEVAIAP